MNISNQGTFKSITSIVCSCLSQMGDSSLVFKLLEKMVLDQLVSWLNFLSISLVYYFSLLTLVDSLFKDMLFLLIWFVFMLQSQTLPLDNVCAMLRMLIALDSEETRISEQAFVSLVEILPRYLIDIVHVSFLFC